MNQLHIPPKAIRQRIVRRYAAFLICSAISTLLCTLPTMSRTIMAGMTRKGPYKRYIKVFFWSFDTTLSSNATISNTQAVTTTAIWVPTTIAPSSFLIPSTINNPIQDKRFDQCVGRKEMLYGVITLAEEKVYEKRKVQLFAKVHCRLPSIRNGETCSERVIEFGNMVSFEPVHVFWHPSFRPEGPMDYVQGSNSKKECEYKDDIEDIECLSQHGRVRSGVGLATRKRETRRLPLSFHR